MSAVPDAITIALGKVPPTDPFGLEVEIDGRAMLQTIFAAGPGLFRVFAGAPEGLIPAGGLIGFLQRGPLLLPVVMPEAGWLLAVASDGARAEHGTPLLCILRAHEGIVP